MEWWLSDLEFPFPGWSDFRRAGTGIQKQESDPHDLLSSPFQWTSYSQLSYSFLLLRLRQAGSTDCNTYMASPGSSSVGFSFHCVGFAVPAVSKFFTKPGWALLPF